MLYHFDTPFGLISYTWDGQCCHAITLQASPSPKPTHQDPVSLWLTVYFSHPHCTTSPPNPPITQAKTPFQAKMRQHLATIDKGETQTYGQCAQHLQTSPRALGQALAANPFPIIIPCHRVVAQHGLGGFAYGSGWKTQLLALERETA